MPGIPVEASNGAPLASPDDLSGFQGAPFEADLVLAAGEAVRGACGWHVAPWREDDVTTVDGVGGRFVLLPTLGLTDVSSVENMADVDNPVAITGYRLPTGSTRFRAGVLDMATGWPTADLQVTFSHGYESCPPDLLSVVAELCEAISRGDLSQRTLGDQSESWRDQLTANSQRVLAKYRIPRSR